MFRFIRNYILDTLFPRHCFGCGAEKEVLCTSCSEELVPAVLLRRTAGEARAYAPFSYHHPALKKALWALKFKGDKEVARVCAALLYDSLIPLVEEYALYSGVTRPLLIPVPISRRRLWERGYNQAELIARELARLDGERSFELAIGVLKKIKNVPPQTSLREKTARLKNIEGCFAVPPAEAARLRGRDVIVLDDIYTTGATFGEAKRALKASGARTIICVAVAH
ncbi:MAG: ComF family protein [Parcubacteria group bacterium]|nr:ComF family protein [Parcubacteria group bacterium]